MNAGHAVSSRITRADIALATLPVSLYFIWRWQRFDIAGALLAATATLLLAHSPKTRAIRHN